MRGPREKENELGVEWWQGYDDISPTKRRRAQGKIMRNPFTPEVLEDPLSNHFKPVSYEYDGTSDPEDHVAKFENVALLHQYTKGVKCRVFSTTLVGATQEWFKQLPSGSVGSFEEMYDVFTRQFASARKSSKSSMHLMTVKHEGEETLWEYVSKFNLTALETPGVDTKIKIHAFMRGLCSGL